MKFSYSQSLEQYIVTNHGETIDADADLSSLMRRHGMLEEAEDVDLLNVLGCLPDPVPGEIVAWVDGEPVFATDDPGEADVVDDLEENLELPDF